MRYRRKYLDNQETDDNAELYRRLAQANTKIEELERRLAKRQVASHWIEPTLLNGVAQVTGTLETFAYQIWTGGRIKFKGHLNIQGASSPAIAFVIDTTETNLHSDMIRHTIVSNTAGTVFTIAMVKIEASTGNVIFTWPAS